MRSTRRTGNVGLLGLVPWRALACVVSLLLVAAPLIAQTIPLTQKLTRLEGRWTRDTTRGTEGACAVPYAADYVVLKVSPSEIRFETNWLAGAFKLDGSETGLGDGRTATAALDAGWLAVTMRRARNGGTTNVMREVYIIRDDELTIWRTLNVVFADGTQGKIDCGNHQVIVYTRSPAR